jgi:hypothetical protein
VAHPCVHDFDLVATAIVGLARQKTLWNAAKERLCRWGYCSRSLRPASLRVLSFLVEHINKSKGFDWHSRDTIAATLGVTGRAVEYAFEELGEAGIILRQVQAIGGTKASRPWRTTLPALIEAAREVTGEREERALARLGRTRLISAVVDGADKPEGAERKRGKDPNNKDEGAEQQRREGPECLFGQTFKEEPRKESLGDADGPLNHDRAAMTVEPTSRKRARQGELAANERPRPQEGACGSQPKVGIEIPRLRPSRRFDMSLPMELRLSIPGGRYSIPQTPDDAALLRRMKRAARGHDLHDLLARFIGHAVSANTPDATEGFIVWMRKWVQEPAPGYVDLTR